MEETGRAKVKLAKETWGVSNMVYRVNTQSPFWRNDFLDFEKLLSGRIQQNPEAAVLYKVGNILVWTHILFSGS